MSDPTDHAGTPLRVGDCVRCVRGDDYRPFLTFGDLYYILKIHTTEGSCDIQRQGDAQIGYGWFLWRFEFVSRPHGVQTRRLTVLGKRNPDV